jgi:hypothetical protein
MRELRDKGTGKAGNFERRRGATPRGGEGRRDKELSNELGNGKRQRN